MVSGAMVNNIILIAVNVGAKLLAYSLCTLVTYELCWHDVILKAIKWAGWQ